MNIRERIIAIWVEHARNAYETHRAAEAPHWLPFEPQRPGDPDYRATAERDGSEFADALLARRTPEIDDEARMAVELAWIILNHNSDPHDTDVPGTVIALLDWHWATI